MGVLTSFGTGFGAYIMGMAVLSPCPLLVHSTSGTVVIVRLFILLHVLTVYTEYNFRLHALSCIL